MDPKRVFLVLGTGVAKNAPWGLGLEMTDELGTPLFTGGAYSASDDWPRTYGPVRTDILSIGEMAQEFGLTARALRFYERKGLLSPQRQGAARLYGPAERQRLALVLRGKQLGFTLEEIRQMLAEPAQGRELAFSRQQCFEQIRLLEQRKREIENALAELRRTYSSFYARMADPTG